MNAEGTETGTPPLAGEVRIVKDPQAPLWAIVCARPCGGAECANTGAHPGFGPLKQAAPVCWLGSGTTRGESAARAARLGWTVLEAPAPDAKWIGADAPPIIAPGII